MTSSSKLARSRFAAAALTGMTLTLLISGCARSQARMTEDPDMATAPAPGEIIPTGKMAGPVSSTPISRDQQIAELRNLLAASQARVEALETKLKALDTKIEATQNLPTRPVSPLPMDLIGAKPLVPVASSDPERGFKNDDTAQEYRKAYVLYQSKQFPEAALAFRMFVEKHPGHTLTGRAQYFVGEAYFQQKDFKSAIREFDKVIKNFDHSSAVPEALRHMADAEDFMNQTDAGNMHRQQLLSLYPQSPAAQDVNFAPSTPTRPARKSVPVVQAPQPAKPSVPTDQKTEQPDEAPMTTRAHTSAEEHPAPAAALDEPPSAVAPAIEPVSNEKGGEH